VKTLAYLWKAIVSLATWIKVLLYLLLSGIAIAIAGYFGTTALIWTAVACLVIGLFIIFFSVLSNWARKRREAELRGELHEAAGIKQRLVSPDRLKEITRTFNVGLQKFEQFNKDYYDLPWFIVAGESGVGKSALVRNSGIELPEHLHDPKQGQSATSAIDWWFTNFAVMLETGGSMLVGGQRDGVTEEWREFCRLLKQHRPDCPINGFVLTLSVDSLLNDSPAVITQKSGVIARHLDSLKKEIELEFPVFVLVTQSDRLLGFTSYFDNLHDQNAFQQILGWSNPAPLEAPFRPEVAEEGLRGVCNRLQRWRLSFLMDPVPRDRSHRRSDEVDTLFDLPHSMMDVLPNLMRYLENIFVAGEWSAQPPTMRGIYFTAAARGDQPRQVPNSPTELGAPDQSKPTSFFLRELLLDKIFREDSLLTRYGKDSPASLRRRLIVFLIGVLLISALITISAFAYRNFLLKTQRQMPLWQAAATNWGPDGWMPVVVPNREAENDSYLYQGDKLVGVRWDPPGQPAGTGPSDLSLEDYHETLAAIATAPLDLPYIFRPFRFIGTNPNTDRLRAQRIVFESSVVRALLTATRNRMSQVNPGGTNESLSDLRDLLSREAMALTELVRIEAAIIQRLRKNPVNNPGDTFIPALLQYTSDVPAASGLSAVMDWTYDISPVGTGDWAPTWTGGGDTLSDNIAINEGINRLIQYANRRIKEFEEDFATLAKLAEYVQAYENAEKGLAKAASIKDQPEATQTAVANAFESLEAEKIQMEQALNSARSAGLFGGGPENLSAVLDNLSSASGTHLGQVEEILKIVDSVLPTTADAAKEKKENQVLAKANQLQLSLQTADEPNLQLMRDIKERLTGISGLIQQRIQAKVSSDLYSQYKALDEAVLDNYDGRPVYLWRWDAYRRCANPAPDYHFRSDMYLLSEGWAQLEAFINAVDRVQTQIDTYSGSMPQTLLTTCSYLLERASTIQEKEYVDQYVNQARTALLQVARFPLVWPPGPENQALDVYQLRDAAALLNAVNQDVASSTFQKLPKDIQQPLLNFQTNVSPLQQITRALIKSNGDLSDVTVTLYNGQAQLQLSGPNLAPTPTPTPTPTPPPRSLMSRLFGGSQPTPDPGPSEVLNTRNWNAVSMATAGASGIFPLDNPSDIVLGKYKVDEAFSFKVYHSLTATAQSETVSGGGNWSALRLIARLGGKPIGVGQDWRLALKPNEPHAVWLKFSFDLPLPTQSWPTLETIKLGTAPAGNSLPSPDSLVDPFMGLDATSSGSSSNGGSN